MRRLVTTVLLGLTIFLVSNQSVKVAAEVPSETECRPYIEKAIHELQSHDHSDEDSPSQGSDEIILDNSPPDNRVDSNSDTENIDDLNDSAEDDTTTVDSGADEESTTNDSDETNDENVNDTEKDVNEEKEEEEVEDEQEEEEVEHVEESNTENNETNESNELITDDEIAEEESTSDEIVDNQNDGNDDSQETEQIGEESEEETIDGDQNDDNYSTEEKTEDVEAENDNDEDDDNDAIDNDDDNDDNDHEDASNEEEVSEKLAMTSEEREDETADEVIEESEEIAVEVEVVEKEIVREAESQDFIQKNVESNEQSDEKMAINETRGLSSIEENIENENHSNVEEIDQKPEETTETEKESEQENTEEPIENEKISEKSDAKDETETTQSFPEDDLLLEYEIPTNLRDRNHIAELLHLDNESEEREKAMYRASDSILKELKRIYENAIKPLETLYKYRDLSNRHFSDPEIFSKPLVLFMGPWSGGKSTILNYLTNNEYTPNSLRTGAEPSPAYFNIVMHGDEPEVLDGTQLAADWTFSGLQKFGQGLEDRLRGQKLPNKLLEKVNIVEIPGILEVRKQVSRLFPFNDACQWFIDRADIIFLVYDPSKLDVGPETEAILDQLKGREYQTRILLNKGDQVKPEELMRVQSALIWNISPLMSSAQPPVMYTTSLWSHPYETGAPVRLLQAQERAFLRDLRLAIDKRIENKIASARRFAVRVRNHAKMVDCYLTTYYNHKSLFGNKKQIANQIIEHPQNYHIYEGLSTLTNISRYDLPDPDVYRDFFRLNNLYDFKKLSETCTYFRGCPINKLDVAIAYDLPELVGKYKKLAESALITLDAKGKR